MRIAVAIAIFSQWSGSGLVSYCEWFKSAFFIGVLLRNLFARFESSVQDYW